MQFVLVLFILPLALTEDIIVMTKYGQVRGTREHYGSEHIDKFLGIPFASPPVGSRRFQMPVPITPWRGVRDAQMHGPGCPQVTDLFDTPFNLTLDEDCLYLNVYAPQITSNSSLPVMVFIHGGAYISGSGAYYDPTVLALKHVVMVTINYRLGVLGFMSTEDKYAPGNYGMLDQVMALQWVKDCIASFGGNPNLVTIFGESAGATSSSLHLISPLSRGLFHSAIMESGVSLAHWAASTFADNPSPLQHTQTLAGKVGCLRANTSDTVQCLRGKPVTELVTAGASILVTNFATTERLQWSPVVERLYSFLPDNPREMIERGEAIDVPVIRGFNKDEDFNIIADAQGGLVNGMQLPLFQALIHKFVTDHYHSNQVQVENAIKKVYLSSVNTSDPLALGASYIQLNTDYDFLFPTVLETQLQAKRRGHNSVFLYEFGYRSPNNKNHSWQGVPHAAELPYVFGAPFVHNLAYNNHFGFKWTDGDRAMSGAIISMWTNFAKHGNPTPLHFPGTQWQPFTTTHQAYLYIDSPARVGFDIRHHELELWNTIIPRLVHQTPGQNIVGR